MYSCTAFVTRESDSTEAFSTKSHWSLLNKLDFSRVLLWVVLLWNGVRRLQTKTMYNQRSDLWLCISLFFIAFVETLSWEVFIYENEATCDTICVNDYVFGIFDKKLLQPLMVILWFVYWTVKLLQVASTFGLLKRHQRCMVFLVFFARVWRSVGYWHCLETRKTTTTVDPNLWFLSHRFASTDFVVSAFTLNSS